MGDASVVHSGAALLTSAEARAARRELEAALEANNYLWSRRLSLWYDALVLLEDRVA